MNSEKSNVTGSIPFSQIGEGPPSPLGDGDHVTLRLLEGRAEDAGDADSFEAYLRELGAPSFLFNVIETPHGYVSLAQALEMSAVARASVEWLRGLPSPSSNRPISFGPPHTSPRELAAESMSHWRLGERGVLARLISVEDTDLSETTQLAVYEALVRVVGSRFSRWPVSRVSIEAVTHRLFLERFFTKWSANYDPRRADLSTYLRSQVQHRAFRKVEEISVGLESGGMVPANSPEEINGRVTDVVMEQAEFDAMDEVVKLYFHGLSYKEIELMTKVSPAAARVRVRRFLTAMRKEARRRSADPVERAERGA